VKIAKHIATNAERREIKDFLFILILLYIILF